MPKGDHQVNKATATPFGQRDSCALIHLAHSSLPVGDIHLRTTQARLSSSSNRRIDSRAEIARRILGDTRRDTWRYSEILADTRRCYLSIWPPNGSSGRNECERSVSAWLQVYTPVSRNFIRCSLRRRSVNVSHRIGEPGYQCYK